MARLKALVPIVPETTVLPEQFQAKTDAGLPAKRLMVAVLERALGETRRTRAAPIGRNAASSPKSRSGSLRMTPAGRSPSLPSATRLASTSLPSALVSESVTRGLDVWRYVQPAGLEQPEHAFG